MTSCGYGTTSSLRVLDFKHCPAQTLGVQVTREKIFGRLRQEVPYEVNLVPMAFEVRRDGSYLIEQQVVVPSKHVRALRHVCCCGQSHLLQPSACSKTATARLQDSSSLHGASEGHCGL